MRPLDGKAWRRQGRRTRRGLSTGRRATHAVETTYGRHQRARDDSARFVDFCAERRQILEQISEPQAAAQESLL